MRITGVATRILRTQQVPKLMRSYIPALPVRFLASPAKISRDRHRAEAAAALLQECKIEAPVMNSFNVHTVKSDSGGAAAPVNGTSVNGANKAMYMDPNVIDPFKLMEPQLRALRDSMKLMVTSDNPVLQKVSQYFFDTPGKHFRPALVLLVAQATPPVGDVNERQRRLSEITEMIHTASLMHDDVMDHGDMRRGVPSLHAAHGNRLAILAGDFLLSRASLNLARLQNVEVIELLSTVIAHLVEGEVMQSSTAAERALDFDYYMRKTYLKTASLLAHSCKAAVLLSGADPVACRQDAESSFQYGKHLGLAFQLQDDVLDFTGDAATLGKAAGSDLREGLTTAPVLFAMEQRPELQELIRRGYGAPGDAERAMELVKASDGVPRSRALAREHAALAKAAAGTLPPSLARDALVRLADMVVERDA